MAEVSSPKSASEDKDSVFPLLDLPPELWIRICKYAVIEDKIIEIAYPEDRKQVEMATQQPAIARVCKTIREETLPMFYQHNEFLIFDNLDTTDDFKGVETWRVNAGAKYRTWLTGLYFTSNDQKCGDWLRDVYIGREFWTTSPKFEIVVEGSPSRLKLGILRGYTYKVAFAGDGVIPMKEKR